MGKGVAATHSPDPWPTWAHCPVGSMWSPWAAPGAALPVSSSLVGADVPSQAGASCSANRDLRTPPSCPPSTQLQVHIWGRHIREQLASSAGCAGAWPGQPWEAPTPLRLRRPHAQELLAASRPWPRVVLGTASAAGPATAPAVALLSQQRRVATHSVALASGRCCPMSWLSQR